MNQPVSSSVCVVFLTHVFPRRKNDLLGAFLLYLAEAYGARAELLVVAPHASELATREAFDAIQIRRFRYAPARWERLAYTGEMHRLVAKSFLNKMLFLFFNFAFFIAALTALRSQRAQVIHAHWWLPGGLIGALAAGLTHTPLIITTHGTDVEQLRRVTWTHSLARWVFARAEAVTCASNYLRDQLIEARVVDAARVSVIPMPVNPLFENVNLKRMTGEVQRQDSERMILTVARLSAQKSLDTLIRALAVLRERGSRARLIIVGDGERRAALEQQTRALNLDAQVEFLGARPQSELPALYAACDVFVLPSIREGMGLVLAEALLCGAPVIATNVGGVTDIVKHNETGLLVPERDPHALADAIEIFLNDAPFALQLATNGRAWVREHYLAEQVAEQFLNLYANVTAS